MARRKLTEIRHRPEGAGSSAAEVSAARETPSPLPPATASRPWGRAVAGAALLLLVSALIYGPAYSGEFIWDDVDIYIVNNPLLRAADGIFRFWFTNEPPDYYPLTYTTFWIEWQFAGDDPRLYHITNIFLHALCGIVLYPLLRRLNAPGASLICLWFVVHPLQVESVAWICQRKTILGALFGFAAAAEYIGRHQQRSTAAYIRSLIWFALSLSAKPTLIMLPVLLAAYELLCVRGSWRAGLVRLGPLFLLSLVFGLIGTAYQQKLIGGVEVRDQDLAARLASVGCAAWFYIGQTVNVGTLSFVYPRWSIDGWSLWFWLPNAALLGVTAVVWKNRSHGGAVPLGAWLAYLITMLPAFGIADVFFWRYSYVGDHYVYQSLPAILALFAWAGSRAAALIPRGTQLLVTLGFAVGLLWGVVSHQRASVYQTEAGLWRETLDKNPRAALAWSGLGNSLADAGRQYVAQSHFYRAVELDPKLFEAWNNLGEIHRANFNWPEARDAYQQAMALAPRGSDFFLSARVGLAAALLQLGQAEQTLALTEEALLDLSRCLKQPGGDRWQPLIARTWAYRQAALQRLGNHADAAHAQAALETLLQTNSEVRRPVAIACEEAGRDDVALQLWLECLRESPDDPAVLLAAGRLASQTGRSTEALKLLSRAADHSPENSAVHSQLGIAQISTGLVEAAVASFETATRLVPDDPRQHVNLALALVTAGNYAEAERSFRRAVELDVNNPRVLRDLAWLLATSPLADEPPKAQDALKFAKMACSGITVPPPEFLDALAAAQAACHEYSAAVASIDRAIAELTSSGAEPERLDGLQQRRALYVQRQPYREQAP